MYGLLGRGYRVWVQVWASRYRFRYGKTGYRVLGMGAGMSI